MNNKPEKIRSRTFCKDLDKDGGVKMSSIDNFIKECISSLEEDYEVFDFNLIFYREHALVTVKYKTKS